MAAGVNNGLNKLFDSPLSLEERMKMGVKSLALTFRSVLWEAVLWLRALVKD